MLIVYKLNFIVGLTFNGILRLIGNEVCDKKRRMFIKTFYNYFPMQKFAKIFPKISSVVTSPVMVPNS